MCCESSDVVRFDLGPLLQGQMKIAKLKSAYNWIIIVQRFWDGKPTYKKSWAGNLLVWLDLTLVKRSRLNKDSQHKSAYNSLVIGPRGLGCKQAWWKSWTGNFLVWSD